MRRLEDVRLITGRGRFAGDIRLPGEVYLALRRSEFGHARIERIDVSAAHDLPGVLAVFTADDIPDAARRVVDDGMPPHLLPLSRPLLAAGEVNHVGEALAAVVAADPYIARDAAERVKVEVQPLRAAGTIESAIRPGAALVHELWGTNVAWWGADGYGDIAAAFAPGAVVVGDRIVMGRVAGAAIEPRASVATPVADGVALWASTQAVFRVRDMLAKGLALDKDRIEVRAADVGGGFGPKGRRYPEDLLVAWAALQLGRPVKWVAGRAEDSASSVQAHGSIFDLEVAAMPDGTLRGLRGVLGHDVGAYPSVGALLPGSILRNMLCAYRLPAVALEIRDVFTNTAPTGTVRGGGATEGNFAIERMLDLLAAHLRISPVEVRYRNLITPQEHPYRVSLSGYRMTIDSGDSPRLVEEAERRIGQVVHVNDGRLRGIGLAIGVEHAPGVFRAEPARIRIRADGMAEVIVGSSPQGQSHETMVAQVAADRIGWPIDRISVTVSDTTLIPEAGPTASSRSAVNVGNAVSVAAAAARRTLLEIASAALKLDVRELELDDGWIRPRHGNARPAADFLAGQDLDVTEIWHASGGTSPASCHAVQVAVDGQTGAIEVERYVVVYDSGVVINPQVVEGQIAGGIVHGLGYALREEAVYEESGTFRTATFRDYEIASPPDSAFEQVVASTPTRTESNPEGFKGAGEVGTVAAPAAVIAAIEAALRDLVPDVRISALPIRPEAILKLIESAG